MSGSDKQRVFLSASIPLPSRNPAYFATADVIAIRDAIRALIMVTIEREFLLVFGGHPAITPMIRLQISQTSAGSADRVILFQSRYFASAFPADNLSFTRVHLVDEVPSDRAASLLRMREQMLMGQFRAGIFVGGMEGVEDEYSMFVQMHQGVPAFPIASTGAAAAKIFERDKTLPHQHPELRDELSYLSLIRSLL
jgi:hypothetical protein